MKAYINITQSNHYEINTQPTLYNSQYEINVSQETLEEWLRITKEFFLTQNKIETAIWQAKFQKHNFNNQEIKIVKENFAKQNPSRMDKSLILRMFGWQQVDTSLWEKDGTQLRLHLAYAECEQEFNKGQ